MTRNGHVRFGERGRETRLSQGRKVRSAPTLLSPLLMNVALHGMETTIIAGYSKSHTVEKPRLIRYADDFVIFHSRLEELLKVSEKVTCWLQDMGLSLSPKKTRITHTLTPYQGQVGFDFLGFTFRQFPVGKTQTGKDTQGKPLGFKTLIKPSKEGVKRHTLTIKGQLRRLRSASQEEVIKDLNPIIWGWAAYYKTANASRTFKRATGGRKRSRASSTTKQQTHRGPSNAVTICYGDS